ncbi:MAG: hypothetical protein WBG30_07005 [Psychrilyobacter sp.]|uniref:hypothetical protein n=1 Tax=Psychrilyobacter sp. TaxID=2586924 RepID=UPI003C736673
MDKDEFMVAMKETIDTFAPLHENEDYKKINSDMKQIHEELDYSILKPEDRKKFHKYEDLVSELVCIVEEVYFKIGYETSEFHGKLSE